MVEAKANTDAAKRNDIGFLEIVSRDEISGWAISPNDETIVEICVNDTPIVAVPANRYRRDIEKIHNVAASGFRLRVSDTLVQHLPETSVISARIAQSGTYLPIIANDDVKLKGGNIKPLLEDKLASGWLVSAKSGDLYAPIGERSDWADAAHSGYIKLRSFMFNNFGKNIFLAYGSLLGPIRSGNFIKHDDDMDVGYISYAESIHEFSIEMISIATKLVEHGAVVKVFDHGHMHVAMPGEEISLDVFGMLVMGNRISGYNFSAPAKKIGKHTKSIFIEGKWFDAPCNPKKLLKAIYGDDWTVEKKHFQWNTSATVEAFMSELERSMKKLPK